MVVSIKRLLSYLIAKKILIVYCIVKSLKVLISSFSHLIIFRYKRMAVSLKRLLSYLIAKKISILYHIVKSLKVLISSFAHLIIYRYKRMVRRECSCGAFSMD